MHPHSESQQGLFSMKRWESEKHKSWFVPAEGFKDHVATDGSLLSTSGKWEACGWSVVQLDYDEELRLLRGMYGSMEAEFEVQRTIKRTWCFGPVDQHLEELHLVRSKLFLVEVQHVKAHRTKKDKKEMSHPEKFVTDGNEKADELAKAGASWDEGLMSETRGKTVQQEREEVHAVLQDVASFHCLVEEWKDCEEIKPKPKQS